MLTLRENLLSRPWQERRYINHRHKVETALPVIDNKPPPQRRHVTSKLKKFQKERERCSQIVSDNFTLLQHLGTIMRTTRVDNAWDEPPPNFLNRVGIYRIRESNDPCQSDEISNDSESPKTRKDRCLGCNPHRYVRKETIPAERVPFPPPKKRISAKPEESTESAPVKDSPKASKERDSGRQPPHEGNKKKSSKRRQRTQMAIRRETQSLELSRGALTLKIRFPFDSGLVFSDRGQDKVIMRERCQCAALQRPRGRRTSSQ